LISLFHLISNGLDKLTFDPEMRPTKVTFDPEVRLSRNVDKSTPVEHAIFAQLHKKNQNTFTTFKYVYNSFWPFKLI
jgi:hypothetical protein